MAKLTDFDPFADRALQTGATTDLDVFIHLMKAALGTGILSMPFAFSHAGLFLGVILTLVIGLICIHCANVLVRSAHRLYYLEQKTAMTYAEVSERAFMNGPNCVHKCAGCVRPFVLTGLFLTYFGTCSVYAVIVAKTLQQVLEHWMNETYNDRLLIASLLIPCIILALIPNYKALAPVSAVANMFIFGGLSITVYYMVQDTPPIEDRKYFDFSDIPTVFSITIFALQAIGVVLPLENSMKTPTHMAGCCGVLSRGLSFVVLLCSTIGFIGYWSYGDKTEETITLNLPVDEIPSQVANLLIALAVFCTIGLQFTVCLEIVWNGIKIKFQERPTFANYVLRIVMMTAAVLIAVAVPSIAPFMGLIGAFCFSIMGVILPVVIEIVLKFDGGYGFLYWILWKDICIIIVGVGALIFGTEASINEILKLYD